MKFVITGTDRRGKRFAPIHTETPWHYNIYCGTVWRITEEGKRIKVKSIIN